MSLTGVVFCIEPRMTLNLYSFSFSLLNAGIIVVFYSAKLARACSAFLIFILFAVLGIEPNFVLARSALSLNLHLKQTFW